MAKSANNLRRWQEAGLLRDLDVHLVESLMRTCCGERLPPPAVQVALALAEDFDEFRLGHSVGS